MFKMYKKIQGTPGPVVSIVKSNHYKKPEFFCLKRFETWENFIVNCRYRNRYLNWSLKVQKKNCNILEFQIKQNNRTLPLFFLFLSVYLYFRPSACRDRTWLPGVSNQAETKKSLYFLRFSNVTCKLLHFLYIK